MVNINLIIPTSNRLSTLKWSLKTCLNQKYKNYKIWIIDNSTNDDTYHYVKNLNNKKVNYYRTEKKLAMYKNWEYGLDIVLSKEKNGYVSFIGDDDGLYPNILSKVKDILEETKTPILKSFSAVYFWPNSKLYSGSLNVFDSNSYSFINSTEILDFKSKDLKYYPDGYFLPEIYKGLVDIDIIRKIKNRDKKFFYFIPDVYSGIILAAEVPKYIFTFFPLFINGHSSFSNGIQQKDKKLVKDVINKELLDEEKVVKKLDLSDECFRSDSIFMAECFMKAKENNDKVPFINPKDVINNLINRERFSSDSITPQEIINIALEYSEKYNLVDYTNILISTNHIFNKKIKYYHTFSYKEYNLNTINIGQTQKIDNVYDLSLFLENNIKLDLKYKPQKILPTIDCNFKNQFSNNILASQKKDYLDFPKSLFQKFTVNYDLNNLSKSDNIFCSYFYDLKKISNSDVMLINQKFIQIWVISEYEKEYLIRIGIIKSLIKVIGIGLEVEAFDNVSEPFSLKTKKKFRFLYYVSNLNKDFFDFLDSYINAFCFDDDVCLILKLNNDVSFQINDYLLNSNFIKEKPEILFISDIESYPFYKNHSNIDCLIGFDLNEVSILEAVYCDTPILTKKTDLEIEILSKNYDYFIDFEEDGSLNKSNLENILLRVYEKPNTLFYNEIKEKYNWENTFRNIENSLNYLNSSKFKKKITTIEFLIDVMFSGQKSFEYIDSFSDQNLNSDIVIFNPKENNIPDNFPLKSDFSVFIFYVNNNNINLEKINKIQNENNFNLFYKTDIEDKLIFIFSRKTPKELSAKPLISICIPTHNKKNTDSKSLHDWIPIHERKLILNKSIMCWNESLNINKDLIEMIIVENGSNDYLNTDFTKISDIPVKYKYEEKSGLGNARKITVEEASSEIIILVNDDTIPVTDTLEKHIKYQSIYNSKGLKLAVLGKFEFHEEAINTDFMVKANNNSEFLFAQNFYTDKEIYHPFVSFYTNNLSILKKAVISAGNFSEEFKVAASDDTDQGIRIADIGYNVVFKEDIRSYHHHTLDLKDYIMLHETRGYWFVELLKKYPNHDEVLFHNVDKSEFMKTAPLFYDIFSEIKDSCFNGYSNEILELFIFCEKYISSFSHLGIISGLSDKLNYKKLTRTKNNFSENKISFILVVNESDKKEDLISLINSLKSQEEKNWELIVIASENKNKVIQKNIANYHFINKNDKVNLSYYKNQAVKLSKGNYINFLNSNMILLPFSTKTLVLKSKIYDDKKILLNKIYCINGKEYCSQIDIKLCIFNKSDIGIERLFFPKDFHPKFDEKLNKMENQNLILKNIGEIFAFESVFSFVYKKEINIEVNDLFYEELVKSIFVNNVESNILEGLFSGENVYDSFIKNDLLMKENTNLLISLLEKLGQINQSRMINLVKINNNNYNDLFRSFIKNTIKYKNKHDLKSLYFESLNYKLFILNDSNEKLPIFFDNSLLSFETETDHNIIHLNWLISNLPNEWLDLINKRFDKVIVDSEYLKTFYQGCGIPSKKIEIVYPLINLDSVNVGENDYLKLDCNCKTKFLFEDTFTNFSYVNDLIDLFTDNFSNNEDICLIIRELNCYDFDISNLIKKKIKNISNIEIILIDEYLTPEKSFSLYNSVDFYLNIQKVENNYENIFKVVLAETPLITMDVGKFSEFCNESNSYLIETEEQYYEEYKIPVLNIDEINLFSVNKSQLVETLKIVAKDKSIPKEKAKKLKKEMEKFISNNDVSDKFQKIINSLKGSLVLRNNFEKIREDLSIVAMNDIKIKDYDSASENFSMLISLDPKTEYYYYLGLSNFNLGDFDSCIDNLSLCIENDYYNKEIFLLLAKSFEMTDEKEEAAYFFERANNT